MATLTCFKCGREITSRHRPIAGRVDTYSDQQALFHGACWGRYQTTLDYQRKFLASDEAKEITAALDRTLAHLARTGEVI